MLRIFQQKIIMAFYAVARGFEAGVYGTWAECERQVKGYSKARFKKFSTRQEALDFIQQFGRWLSNSSFAVFFKSFPGI